MNEEINNSVKNFSEAVSSLKYGVENAKTELEQDGVIQRFEFSFELLWKTLKIFLKDLGVICISPKECLKEAFRLGLFTEDEIFLDMLIDRNSTSHIYSKEKSREIFEKIRNTYCSAMEDLLSELIKRIE